MLILIFPQNLYTISIIRSLAFVKLKTNLAVCHSLTLRFFLTSLYDNSVTEFLKFTKLSSVPIWPRLYNTSEGITEHLFNT